MMMDAQYDDAASAFPPLSARASAPGKLILCGEHAVVYGQPAIALPLPDIRAHVEITAGSPGSGVRLNAPDLGRAWIADAHPDDPLSELVRATLRHLGVDPPDLHITLTSTIPIAGGMGSGAAIATALVRTLATFMGHTLPPEQVSALVYASEERFHGTPSGIDNTVVAYDQPIWFERRGPAHPNLITPISIAEPLTLVVGDTGIRSATRLPVGMVRRQWQANPTHYEQLFAQVGTLVQQVHTALATGEQATLGVLINANQTLLEQIGVSSSELEHLVAAARAAGAPGAKLSGAGWGGVMFALTNPDNQAAVMTALTRAGATRVLATTIHATQP